MVKQSHKGKKSQTCLHNKDKVDNTMWIWTYFFSFHDYPNSSSKNEIALR